jgi:hypothetical protein
MAVYAVYVEKCRGHLKEFDSRARGGGGGGMAKALEMGTMKGVED